MAFFSFHCKSSSPISSQKLSLTSPVFYKEKSLLCKKIIRMNYENLKTEFEDGILLVTLNREKALNALNKQTMFEIRYLFEAYATGLEGLKGIILTGAGTKAFVAGADIKEFMSLDAEAATAMSKNGQDIFFLIENFPKPVIAAVNGFALGGGCELAMACHLRIAGEKARFGQPEVNLGLIAGYGGTQRLTQLVGKAKSMELHLTGDMIGAEEAHRLGLVNHVVPQGEEVSKAKEIIQKIGAKAPLAVAKAIQCINAHFNEGKQAYKREYEGFGALIETEDIKEGVAAFLEKRTADFKGK